ncbi:MAG: transporter substrate-binding protein [Tardiphaga sp.]|nr:transporter substrate-binding protein [Tardiphaga sp.]
MLINKMLINRRTALLSTLAIPALASRAWSQPAPDKVRLGQPTTSLSFLKIFAARALDTFAAENIALEWASIPGGDPAVLAAVDSGDLELAAVGSDTALAAIAKGQPFKIIYTLMSKLPYDLTVSKAFLAKSGVALDAPLNKRLGVLETAVVGVSALGGAQDRVARWLATQGGLSPKDVKLAVVGSPPALGAALENGRIDAFVLSPPESAIAVDKDYGTVLVRPSKEIAGADIIPSLVLVAKSEPTPEVRARIVRTLRAMNAASDAVAADPNKVSDKITEKFFSKVSPSIIRASVNALVDGLGGNGRLTNETIAALLKFSTQTGGAAPQAKDFWTNSYVEAALKKA